MPEIIDATLRALATIINFTIIWALQIVYSYQTNPRRLEDTTYGVWTNVFAILLRDHLDVFIINPQLSIYTSPKQEAIDPNASFSSHRTTVDSEAHGVITDIAITYVKSSSSTQSSIRSIIPTGDFSMFERQQITRKLKLDAWFAPILVELKSSPNRHITDLEGFMLSREKRLVNAMDQVVDQALCLFSSPKFCLQQEIFLIAGTGEWWAFTVMCREQARNWIRAVYSDGFRLDEYQGRWWDREVLDEDEATVEDAAPCDILRAGDQGLTMVQAAANNAIEAARQQANRERDERARRRARKREMADALQQEWMNFIETVRESERFEDQDIEVYEEFVAKSDGLSVREKWPDPKDLRALSEAAGRQLTPSLDSKPKFTQPARFGSLRSARYLAFLKAEMVKIALVERSRRGY